MILTNDSEDRVRALVRLNSFEDTFLFIGRFVDARVLGYLAQTREVVEEYRSLELRRSGIERAFAIIFGVVALLLLLAATWVGLIFANGVASRISQLTKAANLVSAGDLTVRMPENEKSDEIDDLQITFNRMTDQLSSQRDELIEANSQLDQRRAFTEAVIGGVVLGGDRPRPPGPDHPAQPVRAGIPGHERRSSDRPAGDRRAARNRRPAGRRDRRRRTYRRWRSSSSSAGPTAIARCWCGVSAQLDDEIQIEGFVVTFEDITELLGAQRTAAWSEIARRIAHEIKNPLTPIRLSAERLKRKYLPQIERDQDTFTGSIDTIVRQVDTIGNLINEFSAFARMPAPVFDHESACDLVRQAVYLQQGARAEVRFETDLPDADIQLYCDSRKVAQALTNLVQNAVQSVLQRLKSETGGEPERGWVLVRLEATEQFCSIEVHDNGLGLPADEPVGRLTEPYVTKRADGTGLGLAIVKKIMEEHAGTISLANRDGGGACVTLSFPMIPAAGKAAAE